MEVEYKHFKIETYSSVNRNDMTFAGKIRTDLFTVAVGEKWQMKNNVLPSQETKSSF